MPDWDAAQYLKFAGQRTRPALDLAARIPLAEPADVLDVGCGPGNSTEVLAARYPRARILGIDSSPQMIREAARNHPQMEFRLCDAGRDLAALGRQFDVVFSNACIQSREKWRRRLPDKRIFHQLRPEEYFRLLSRLSPSFELWQTTYFHRLPSHEAILEWYRGTGLRPYLALLTAEERVDFEGDILVELIRAYPREENGEILFRFPRFFFLARR